MIRSISRRMFSHIKLEAFRRYSAQRGSSAWRKRASSAVSQADPVYATREEGARACAARGARPRHNYIGTEHLLLGLIRENEGIATSILSTFDVDVETIRGEIIRMLSGSGTDPQVGLDLDRSWLDFTPASALELAMRLAPLSRRITFEVRRHAEEEPTFRVSCQLTGSDDAVRQLAALEADGVRAVLDQDRTVPLGRLEVSAESDASGAGGD
jgi:hypothetical protein